MPWAIQTSLGTIRRSTDGRRHNIVVRPLPARSIPQRAVAATRVVDPECPGSTSVLRDFIGSPAAYRAALAWPTTSVHRTGGRQKHGAASELQRLTQGTECNMAVPEYPQRNSSDAMATRGILICHLAA